VAERHQPVLDGLRLGEQAGGLAALLLRRRQLGLQVGQPLVLVLADGLDDELGVLGEDVDPGPQALEDRGALRLSLMGWRAAIVGRSRALAVHLAQRVGVVGVLGAERLGEVVERVQVGGYLAAQPKLFGAELVQLGVEAGGKPV
jgi:hypothetical protein